MLLFYFSFFLVLFMPVSEHLIFSLYSISASVLREDFIGSDVQSQSQNQIQQEADQMGKQGAGLVQKLEGSSRSAMAKLKLESAKRTGSRANQRLPTSRTGEPLPTSRTGEPSRTKSRSSKMQQGQSTAVSRSNESRTRKKNICPESKGVSGLLFLCCIFQSNGAIVRTAKYDLLLIMLLSWRNGLVGAQWSLKLGLSSEQNSKRKRSDRGNYTSG
jgi:hypothetical protein